MRRHLKIKTLPLLIAWMMIFLHGIIPHNHADDCIAPCRSMIHFCEDGVAVTTGHHLIMDQNTGGKVCHISSLLFNNLHDDHLILHLYKVLIISPEIPDSKVIVPPVEQGLPGLFHGTTSFRAPPEA